MQAGYNPLMLAVASDIEITNYQDMLCHLIDKTGVNLTAEKVSFLVLPQYGGDIHVFDCAG